MATGTIHPTETYCRCGHETEMQCCPRCGSTDRFSFTSAPAQKRRPPQWMYLVAGLALQALAIGAAAWMLS